MIILLKMMIMVMMIMQYWSSRWYFLENQWKTWSWQYFKKGVKGKFDFLNEDKHQSWYWYYKLILPFLVAMARHAHITQNNKFALNSQYLQIKGRDEVLFCVQVNTKLSYKVILFRWARPVIPKVPKITILVFFWRFQGV